MTGGLIAGGSAPSVDAFVFLILIDRFRFNGGRETENGSRCSAVPAANELLYDECGFRAQVLQSAGELGVTPVSGVEIILFWRRLRRLRCLLA